MQTTDGVQYKCMYRLASGKFIVRRDGLVIGTFAGEQQAARALAAHMCVGVGDLKKRVKKQHTIPQTAPAMASGVYQAHGGKFEARLKIKGTRRFKYCGRFDTAEDATKNLARISGARPCASKKVDRVKLAAKRFRTAKGTFKTWRPADMQDLIQVRKKEPLFCIAPGPLYMIVVNGKEKFWRATIVRLARQLPANTKANLSALSSRIGAGDHARGVRTKVAQDVYRLLADACRAMTKRPAKEQAYFVRHVNRNVTHHAGWLPVMQRMGILAKTTMEDKSRLVFGDPRQAYNILPFSQQLVTAFTKMSGMQQALLAMRPPRTPDDWLEAWESFEKMAREGREK